jgi:hypothetical protein
MVISSMTSSDQFAFKEGDKITFKTYGKKKFIDATINQITDSLLIFHKDRFSQIFSVRADSISAVKKLKGTHIFTRTLSALAIITYTGVAIESLVDGDPEDDGIAAAMIPLALIFSIPWFIPARVLYIGNEFKIEIRND